MKKEASFGIIPLRKHRARWEVLLVQPHQGWWGIPKGHADANETDKEAAERELFEETGLTVANYLADVPLQENYQFFLGRQKIYKTVTYYLAEVKGEVILQAEELKGFKWVPLSSAATYATYKETQTILNKAKEWAKDL